MNEKLQPKDEGFHGQEKVYRDLGEEMLDHSFEGNVIMTFKMVGFRFHRNFLHFKLLMAMH